MAGYIFSLDNLTSLTLYTQHGVYATKLSPPAHAWKLHHEGTFADYLTMQAGDNIYFFIQRKIYGIGKLVNINGDCKYFNFPGAGRPQSVNYADMQSQLLWDEGELSANQRCICLFEPDPYFFRSGIDMDDVLASNPTAFKMLRAFWKLSFIKFDDDENQAFRDIVLKRHHDLLDDPTPDTIFPFQPQRDQLSPKLANGDYRLDAGISAILASCAEGETLKHEMAIEAGLLHQLATHDSETCAIFGHWDYLSHQVIASPFKPIDYMDKMDLFGYAYLTGFKPTKARYLVGEIKKDAAQIEDVDQLLKYVDWVKDEYCFGDYAMIQAFLIASDFNDTVIRHARQIGARQYTIGVRPARSVEWRAVHLIAYTFHSATRKINVRLV